MLGRLFQFELSKTKSELKKKLKKKIKPQTYLVSGVNRREYSLPPTEWARLRIMCGLLSESTMLVGNQRPPATLKVGGHDLFLLWLPSHCIKMQFRIKEVKSWSSCVQSTEHIILNHVLWELQDQEPPSSLPPLSTHLSVRNMVDAVSIDEL